MVFLGKRTFQRSARFDAKLIASSALRWKTGFRLGQLRRFTDPAGRSPEPRSSE